jgi:hypothetical protein
MSSVKFYDCTVGVTYKYDQKGKMINENEFYHHLAGFGYKDTERI